MNPTIGGHRLACGMPTLLLYAANESYKACKDVPRRFHLRPEDYRALCDEAPTDLREGLCAQFPRIYGIPIVRHPRRSMIEHASGVMEDV